MLGRIKRKQASKSATIAPSALAGGVICPLCERTIPTKHADEHHLIPKSKGGKETVTLHRICHRQVHALLTETELEREYFTIDRLKSHAELQRFVVWVKGKPDDFMQRTRKSRRMRGAG
jgi:5-methylcytosine-specific restriction endonuclease McrA